MLPLMDFSRPTAHVSVMARLLWRRIPSPPRAACGVWLPPARRKPRCLAAPDTFRRHTPASVTSTLERPWASPSKGFPSTAIGSPFGARALMPLPRASVPHPKAGDIDTRPSSGPCSRGESVLHRSTGRQASRHPDRRSLPGFLPLQSLRPPELAHALSSRGLPSHTWMG